MAGGFTVPDLLTSGASQRGGSTLVVARPELATTASVAATRPAHLAALSTERANPAPEVTMVSSA